MITECYLNGLLGQLLDLNYGPLVELVITRGEHSRNLEEILMHELERLREQEAAKEDEALEELIQSPKDEPEFYR